MCLWYERMVSLMWMCLQANGWLNGQRMEWMWLCCISSAQHRLKNQMFSVLGSILYTLRQECVTEKPEAEREDRNKECPFGKLLSTSVWLAWMDWEGTNNKQPTTHEPTTLQVSCPASCMPWPLYSRLEMFTLLALMAQDRRGYFRESDRPAVKINQSTD